MNLDGKDRRLLALLQERADRSLADLAEAVNLSTTPCWRRVQRLEAEGYLSARVALLDRGRLNVGVTVFAALKAGRHEADWLEAFHAAVRDIPEIVEAYRMSGDTDYLLKIVVPDIAAYDAVYRRLIEAVSFGDVSSSFAMEELKFTTAVPLTYA